MDCIFCDIIEGKIPCYKIYEDELTLAFLSLGKQVYGHTLVIPKTHCTNILDCPTETLSAVMNTVKKVSNHYVDNCGFDGVNVLNASGKCAEQTVFHLHFHIMPRKNNDNISCFPDLQPVNIDMQQVCNHLKINK